MGILKIRCNTPKLFCKAKTTVFHAYYKKEENNTSPVTLEVTQQFILKLVDIRYIVVLTQKFLSAA